MLNAIYSIFYSWWNEEEELNTVGLIERDDVDSIKQIIHEGNVNDYIRSGRDVYNKVLTQALKNKAWGCAEYFLDIGAKVDDFGNPSYSAGFIAARLAPVRIFEKIMERSEFISVRLNIPKKMLCVPNSIFATAVWNKQWENALWMLRNRKQQHNGVFAGCYITAPKNEGKKINMLVLIFLREADNREFVDEFLDQYFDFERRWICWEDVEIGASPMCNPLIQIGKVISKDTFFSENKMYILRGICRRQNVNHPCGRFLNGFQEVEGVDGPENLHSLFFFAYKGLLPIIRFLIEHHRVNASLCPPCSIDDETVSYLLCMGSNPWEGCVCESNNHKLQREMNLRWRQYVPSLRLLVIRQVYRSFTFEERSFLSPGLFYAHEFHWYSADAKERKNKKQK